MSNIIGVYSVNGNGFYPPNEIQLNEYLSVIDKYNINSDENMEYPKIFCIIGYQIDDKMLFKQYLEINNTNQLYYVFNIFSRYGTIFPKSHLNEKGLNLPNDYIVNVIQLSEYMRL
jgi:hypothetical protein